MLPTASLGPGAILSAMLLFAVADAPGAEPAARNPGLEAQQILTAAHLSGGLIVHLGCGDGRLTAALHASDAYLVQGLDTDADRVRQARQHIRQTGMYGPVAVEQFDGKRLPYAENLVNLVVADDLGGVARDEVLRALAPGGKLCTRQSGGWSIVVKPRPANTDEWTHFLHDASGNPVAHDQVVGPPRSAQWIAEPRHTRSHEHIPSIYALVSAGGRIFYIADEGPIASLRQTPQWQLIARDAYNGTLLWKRPIAAWYPHIVNWGQTPSHLERRLVAVGDRVYVTLGVHAPLSVLDAASGALVKVYENTAGTEEIIVHRGVLSLVVRSVTRERTDELADWARYVSVKKGPLDTRDTAEPLVARLRRIDAQAPASVVALDADAGSLLWKRDGASSDAVKPLSLSADGDRVFYQNGKEIVCVELRTGRQLWTASQGGLRVVSDRSIVCALAKTVTALAPGTGKTLWSQVVPLTDIKEVFFAHDSLWLGGFKPCPGKRGPPWGPYFVTQLDPASGKILRNIEPENPGHHHRCYSNKATDRYILAGRRGVEFIDLESGDVGWNSWVRGVCRYGVMPCNGLLYAPPHACGCYIAAKLTGFYALASASPTRDTSGAARDADRLVRGPAAEEREQGAGNGGQGKKKEQPRVGSSNPQSPVPNPADWPTYRHDAQRSGSASAAVPAELHRQWQAQVGPRLTSPTVAGGKLFVASVDEHTVAALAADSGAPLWQFTAGARVDSPPTCCQGRAIFGCRDGSVYSLRASDGAVAWRLQTARDQRRIVACGQLESASPVPGSVLVQEGAVYFTAGRSSYLDGGIDLYRVDPATGAIQAKTALYSPDPQTGKQPPQSAPFQMPGHLADILSGDSGRVYLRDQAFDPQCVAQPQGSPHLLTLTGFLDDTWPHRSDWIFGTQCSISIGCSKRDKDTIAARLLVFDAATIYGFGRKTVHWSNQFEDGPYRLFARKRDAGEPQWEQALPIEVRALVLAGPVLFAAGPGGEPSQPAQLLALSAADGRLLAHYDLDAAPVFDGMAAASGRLYLTLQNGRVLCMAPGGTR